MKHKQESQELQIRTCEAANRNTTAVSVMEKVRSQEQNENFKMIKTQKLKKVRERYEIIEEEKKMKHVSF